MSMLARYKKNEKSFLELVKLIESSADAKRENLMKMVREEDPTFAEKVMAHVIDVDTIRSLEDGLIAEIVSNCSPKVLATILVGEKDEKFKKVIEKSLGKLFSEVKSEKEALGGTELPEAKLISCYLKMITETRKLMEAGAIRIPPKAVVGGASMPVTSTLPEGPQQSGGDSATTASPGSATEEDGCPQVSSFGIERPPGGLSGERFKEYVRKKLA